MASIQSTVRDLMSEHPEYAQRPLAYEHRERLVIHTQVRLRRLRVSPEAVTRAQRRVWRGQ